MISSTRTDNVTQIKGTVLRITQLTVHDTAMTQAMINTSDSQETDLLTCMWRTASKPVILTTNAEYTFSGSVRDLDGRRLMVEPEYELVKDGRSKIAAKIAAITLTKKRIIVAAVAIFIGFGVVLPVSLASRNKNPSDLAGAALMPALGINNLPPATDASGKAIATTPTDCDIVDVAFTSTDRDDPSLPLSQTKLNPSGINGQNKLCYAYGRARYPVTIQLKKPVNQIKLIGTKK